MAGTPTRMAQVAPGGPYHLDTGGGLAFCGARLNAATAYDSDAAGDAYRTALFLGYELCHACAVRLEKVRCYEQMNLGEPNLATE